MRFPHVIYLTSLCTLLSVAGCAAKATMYSAPEAPMPVPATYADSSSVVTVGSSTSGGFSNQDFRLQGNVKLDADTTANEREIATVHSLNTKPTSIIEKKSLAKNKGKDPAPHRGAPGEKTESEPTKEILHEEPPSSSPRSPEPEPTESTPASIRQMIYTAQMVVSVFKIPEASSRIEEMIQQAGGYIQSMTGNMIVLRIPAAKLRPFMKSVGGFGIIESQSLQAQDVTEEYTDLSSRIRVLQQTQAQLLELLSKARTVDEALHVRQALDQVTMELEQALGRMRMLENLIGFSTLTIQLQERGPYTQVPSASDPFPWVNQLGVEATEWK